MTRCVIGATVTFNRESSIAAESLSLLRAVALRTSSDLHARNSATSLPWLAFHHIPFNPLAPLLSRA
jgi:hypothetical protein